MFAELKYEDMSDEQLARHMHAAGLDGTDGMNAKPIHTDGKAPSERLYRP